MNNRAVVLALLSAALFGVSTPAAKILLGTIDPAILAGLLYFGAGFGRRLGSAVAMYLCICVRRAILALIVVVCGPVIAGTPEEEPARPKVEAAAPHESHDGDYVSWCGIHFLRREFQLATEDCDVALRVDPTDGQLFSNRGAAYLMLGRPDSAISDFQSGLQLAPNDALLHFNLGTAHTAKGEHEAAIAYYTEAIRLTPTYVAAYINRGTAFDILRQREQAIADYEKALEILPSLSSVRARLRWLRGQ